MYHSFGEVWRGLSKNAREGLAAPRLILPITLILLLGQVLPLVLFLTLVARFAVLIFFKDSDFYSMISAYQQSGLGLGLALSSLAVLAMYYPRFDAAFRFRQPAESAMMHPFGIIVLLAIQWYALVRGVAKCPNRWKGRSYPV